MKRLLLARTEGNPLFLEESVRSLVDNGTLAGERGAYQRVKTPDTVHVPATVQAILAARVDRLPPEDKNLLQTASVVGTEVPVAVLAGVARVPADALAEGLARLQAAEFLYETSLFPDVEYTFKHALTHEVAYGSLPRSAGAPSTAGRLRSSRAYIPRGLRSTSSVWPTTRSEARCGRRTSLSAAWRRGAVRGFLVPTHPEN